MIDVLYNFISPVTGRLPLTENYILIGGRQGFSVMSPKLIDIELELININHVLGDLSTTAFILGAPNPKLPLSQDLSSLNNGFMFNTAGTISTTNNLPLPSLPYNNIWVGNINNVAVPTPYVASQNNSSFILQTPNPNLPNSQALALLLGGILKSAAVTGVISIAIPDVDYATVATLEELAAEAAASAEEATGAAAEASASAAEATASAAEATGAAAEATGAAAEASFSAFEASLSAIEAGLSAIEASGAAAEATTSAAAAAISATEAAGSATAAALSATDAAISATAATTSAAEAATSATAASGYSAAAAASASGAAASAVDASSSASEAQDYLNTLLATGLNDLPCTGDVSFQGYTLINLGTPINPTDGANKEYVDNAISGLPYSTLTLQGAITGSGPLNLPVITTLNTTLNQITNAGNVNIANFLLNNVLDPINPQDGATKNYVDNATIAPSQISNYPSNSSLFLNGTGSWTAPSFSNLITTSSVGYEITINNTNASSTNTGLLIQNNGYNAVNFGFNNSTKEAYVWAYGSNALLKFGTNATTRMQLLSNGTLDLLTNTITGLATPINPTDGVNKQYVDTAVSGLPYSSLTLQGAITGSGPLNLPVITTLNTTLNQITNAGNVNIGNYNLNNVLDPINPQDGATKNYVDTSTIAPSRIISYPSNSSLFLNGAGSWTAPSFSNFITTSSVGYEITINNTNASSTNTGFLIQNNGFNVVNFGFNNSTNEAYVWAYGNALLKFGTNATTRMQLLNNGTLDLLTNTITGLANPVNPTDGVNKQYVDNATIVPSQISNYPSNSSLFLNGAGSWTAPSFSNLITTNSSSYELTINNTNPNSTDTGLLIQNNGYNAVNFGFNNSTKEAYVWAYGSNALLKFGTNATTRMQLLSNGTLDLLTNTITGLANPVNPTDGVNKQYVDSIIASSQQISLVGAIIGTGQTGTPCLTTLNSLVGLTTNQVFNFTGSPTSFNYDLTIPNSTNQTVKLRLNRANTGNGAGYEFQFYSPTNGLDTFTFGYNSGSVFGNIYSIVNNVPVINYTYSLNVSDSGTYQPYNGSYGYLSSNGSTGQATGQNSYSINCTNRVKASEFDAVSSKKLKTILGKGDEIEHTAIELFKEIPLFKYKYKDTIKEGNGDHYGVIAEELAEIIPAFVNMQDEGWIPNIYKNCMVEKGLDNSYKLYFDEKLENIDGDRLKLIFRDKEGEKNAEVMITEITADSLSVICCEKLPKDIFVYGTYSKCPTVSKQKVFELGLVALQNIIKRVESLENKLRCA